MEGWVSDIQRFSIHDGPGIRTTVFLKGCNLRCFWCHNPETLVSEPQLQLFLDRCIGCGECFLRCPRGAHVGQDGQRIFLRELCLGCGLCADTCYAQALVLVGKAMTAEAVLEEVLRDRPFYDTSGGGVTLSGGEPLLQPEFSRAILSLCRDEGLHTAIETAAAVPWQRLEALLPLVDLVMLDIKHANSARHREATGVPNERILANAQALAEQRVPLIVRTPVIPGVNDDEESIAAIATFAATLDSLQYYELLPFHPMAAHKYASLGLPCPSAALAAPPKEQLDALVRVAERQGVTARHG